MTDESDETTIDELNFDDYDIDGILLDLQKEVEDEVPPPVDQAYSDRSTVDVMISYRDPDTVDYRREPYLLELSGHLWNVEFPVGKQTAEDILAHIGWFEEIGLDMTVEQAAELGVDVSEYVEEAADE
jgi:hypothetical protein